MIQKMNNNNNNKINQNNKYYKNNNKIIQNNKYNKNNNNKYNKIIIKIKIDQIVKIFKKIKI